MALEEKISQMTTGQYIAEAGKLTVAHPMVFIGFLLGGAVPFLFSSMLIRAVGRAAFLIVKECRDQFRDADIWAGKKKPNYGRVVDICTSTAQKELVGPGFLAILTPIAIADLRPTQITVGMREVKAKRLRWRENALLSLRAWPPRPGGQ